MELSKLIIMGLLTFYSGYCLRLLLNKNSRENIISTNNKLNDMRKKPIKTLEEQKEFLNTKFPKSTKEKYFFKTILKFLKTIVFYIPFGLAYYYILNNYVNVNIPLWVAVLFIIFFPTVINLLLKKFGVEKDDISIYLKGRWFKK